MILKVVGPSKWIPIVMLSWGTVVRLTRIQMLFSSELSFLQMACMAACKNSAGLLASRFFLGITEAGLFPGIIFYLSLWYTRGEQATRVALFFSCSTLAGVMIHCIVSKCELIFF